MKRVESKVVRMLVPQARNIDSHAYHVGIAFSPLIGETETFRS
jgi:hypothetical protein